MKKKMCLIKVSQKDAQYQRELYVPYHESDIEVSRSFALGQEISASASASDLRNLGFHKKFFALLKMAFHNMPEKYAEMFKNIEELRIEILIQTGFRYKRTSIGGQEYHVPKSMSFDKMGAEAFEDLYKKTLDFLCKYILVGLTDKEVEAELLGFM